MRARRTTHFFANSDKAKAHLGWQPKHTFLKDVDSLAKAYMASGRDKKEIDFSIGERGGSAGVGGGGGGAPKDNRACLLPSNVGCCRGGAGDLARGGACNTLQHEPPRPIAHTPLHTPPSSPPRPQMTRSLRRWGSRAVRCAVMGLQQLRSNYSDKHTVYAGQRMNKIMQHGSADHNDVASLVLAVQAVQADLDGLASALAASTSACASLQAAGTAVAAECRRLRQLLGTARAELAGAEGEQEDLACLASHRRAQAEAASVERKKLQVRGYGRACAGVC